MEMIPNNWDYSLENMDKYSIDIEEVIAGVVMRDDMKDASAMLKAIKKSSTATSLFALWLEPYIESCDYQKSCTELGEDPYDLMSQGTAGVDMYIYLSKKYPKFLSDLMEVIDVGISYQQFKPQFSQKPKLSAF